MIVVTRLHEDFNEIRVIIGPESEFVFDTVGFLSLPLGPNCVVDNGKPNVLLISKTNNSEAVVGKQLALQIKAGTNGLVNPLTPSTTPHKQTTDQGTSVKCVYCGSTENGLVGKDPATCNVCFGLNKGLVKKLSTTNRSGITS